MKTIGSVVCALALAAGCVAGPSTDQSALALTGSGSGSGTGSGTGSGATSVWHSTWSGRSASAYSYDGTTSLWLDVAENTSGKTRSAFLNFTYSGPDPSSYTCYTYNDWWWGSFTYCYYTQYINEYGWGPIPAGDFQATANASQAHVHTTTDPNTFGIQKCTWSYWGWYQTCTYGGSESFDIAWNQNGMAFNSSNGTSRYGFGGYSVQNVGQYSAKSADAAGTAAGLTLSGTNTGWISDSKGTSVARDVVPTPQP